MDILIPIGIVLLVLCGAPLYIIFGSIALYAFHIAGINLSAVIIGMMQMTDAPTLSAIPLFTFAGYLMAESKTPERIINLAKAGLGWMPGGTAIVCILACAFFTAFTGASGVTIIALGGLMFPILMKERYPEKFSLGLVTSCGSLGLLWFPSLPVILYGMVSGVFINDLFLAGIIPGFILVIILSAYSIFKGNLKVSTKEPFCFKKMGVTLWRAKYEVALPFIIGFAVFGGFMTAGQASALTAVYVLVVEVFIYKDLNLFKDVPRIAKDSMILVASILIILAVALGFTNYLGDAKVPQQILAWIGQYIDPNNKIGFLIALNIFLLIVGCLMDIFSAIIIVVPIILPVAQAFGIHPTHLGIIFLTNLEIGYLTPPVGINLFISSIRFKKSVTSLYRSALPFLLLLLIALALITYIPDLSLMIPNFFSK